MTPEQLDEIEKLHAAATPGEWEPDVGVDFEHGNPNVEWYACGPSHKTNNLDEAGYPLIPGDPAHAQASIDAGSIAALHNAFPAMAKALREARADIERLKMALQCSQNELGEHYCNQCQEFVRP